MIVATNCSFTTSLFGCQFITALTINEVTAAK